jgi:hypothetical protein
MEALSHNKNERRTNELNIRRSTHPRLKAWPRGLRPLRCSFASLRMTALESSAKEIHLCEVNQFVASPIDHSFKQEQTEQFHFFKVLSRHVLFLSFCMFQ